MAETRWGNSNGRKRGNENCAIQSTDRTMYIATQMTKNYYSNMMVRWQVSPMLRTLEKFQIMI